MANPRRKTRSVGASGIDDGDSPFVDVDESSPSHHAPSQPSPSAGKQTPVKGNFLRLLVLLLPPALLTLGLSIFTQSFFLSRTSFDHRSSCDVGSAGKLLSDALGLEKDHVEFLRRIGFLSDGEGDDDGSNYGCWVPRRVDSMAILVVDALRFDFARDHLPLSVGSRLYPSQQNHTHDNNNRKRGISKLYQFVADPPTVTMQRLKGITTGGLPTFADISGSFGGASIDEDSWVEQLKDVAWNRRQHYLHSLDSDKKQPKIAFVGDDTWVDLFPNQFDDCHPFPSFNTRDLDTVDNGCLKHLPRLLDGLVGLKQQQQQSKLGNSTSAFELIVAHFLGVDHVGHTYGPNNPHMEEKLHQMDVMLSDALNTIDAAPAQSCIVALVLGDHGMTEDGNHGGGTSEEVNAGLFVHFSPGCDNEEDGVRGEEIGQNAALAFDSIHQIDLVPTISFLMGLPVPYANIGGLAPDLLPTPRDTSGKQSQYDTPHIATALALNAAQVWNYLHTYSQTSRDLPVDRLRELKELLDSATLVYRDAISQSRNFQSAGGNNAFDSTAYRQACALFKIFLAESTDLGKQVWTQFNEQGMMLGIGILVMAWIMAIPLWKRSVRCELVKAIFPGMKHHVLSRKQSNGTIIKENMKGNGDGMNTSIQSYQRLETVAAAIFMIFQCVVLTFGNSYIEHEREIVTFFLATLCLLVFRRWYFASGTHSVFSSNSMYLPLVVVLCSRMNDVLVTGHGLDPSMRLHTAHHPVVFLLSLCLLASFRLRWLDSVSLKKVRNERALSFSIFIDLFAIICLASSWLEKHTLDQSRNGLIQAQFAMMAVFFGLAHSLFQISWQFKVTTQSSGRKNGESWIENAQLALFRAMIFLVIVTGPSTSSTAVLVVVQCAALRFMMESSGARGITAPVMAAILRLAIRHVFFATNHHCSFNRLQFSAAFVATETFQFYIAGLSLFMNTFGWEILGSCLVLVYSRRGLMSTIDNSARSNVWDWFRYFQWTEMLASCMSVSVMKRHLMVWAIFAPRFMFAAVFTVIGLILWVLDVIIMERSTQTTTALHKS